MASTPIPVILDTDIGDDIDDLWALAFLLRCPELEPVLISVAPGDSTYRAKLVAKFLEITGRTDIPIALGDQMGNGWGPQAGWVLDYDLDEYSGHVLPDSPGQICETITNNTGPERVVVIGIGPLTNVAGALARDPKICQHSRFVGMQGSISRGYSDLVVPSPEYNVVQDIAACKAVFSAPWDVTITPLDTCGRVVLQGDLYQRIRDHSSPLLEAIIENYEIWELARTGNADATLVKSSVLFDTVAIFLAFSYRWLQMEKLPVVVDETGYTRLDASGNLIHCATCWDDIEAFMTLLVDRLTS